MIKYGAHFLISFLFNFKLGAQNAYKSYFYSISNRGPKMHPEARGTEQKVVLAQTRHFGANRVIRIFIRARFQKMLTKVNCWPILKAKIQNSVQTYAEGLGSVANYACSLIWPF